MSERKIPESDMDGSERKIDGSLMSPIRPAPPEPPQPSKWETQTITPIQITPEDVPSALAFLRQKMEETAIEFSNGNLNRAQFTAIYKHYNEKRTIIEKIYQRDPQSDAWKQVAEAGSTGFLRRHFEARPVFFVVFLNNIPQPLLSGGEQTTKAVTQISKLLKVLWSLEKPAEKGVARKSMGDGQWLVVAVGDHSVTFVIFSRQPSNAQTNLVRDLHEDFERANRLLLERKMHTARRMVFPQRALIPQMG